MAGDAINSQFEPGLVSIITPTFNRAALISGALDSVREQTYRPLEVVVVDDGSQDDTADRVAAWQAKNCDDSLRITFIRQENAGPGAARNRGLTECRGEFIQFLDSDDRLHPERLTKLVAMFRADAELDYIQTGFDGFCADCGTTIEQNYGKPDRDQLALALQGTLWANTLRPMFRREVLVKVGFWNTTMSCFEDYEYVVRVLGYCRKNAAVRDILASAQRGGGGVRVTDKLRTHEGRGFRILCEESLANAVRQRDDVRQEDLQAFASRLYALGFRSAASGWPDHARRCGELAASLGVPLDKKGRRRRMAWKLGKWGGRLYEGTGVVRDFMSGGRTGLNPPHECYS